MKIKFARYGILALIFIGIIFISGCVKQQAPESTATETASQQAGPETPKQEELGFWQKLDSVEVLPSKTLDAERYGSEACYLGSLAMLFHYDNPAITYENMLSQEGITYEPGSGKINDLFRNGVETTPEDILNILPDFGYDLYIGYSEPDRSFQHHWLSSIPSQQAKEFSNEQEAEDYLKKAISSGLLPMVTTIDYNVIIKYLVPSHPAVPTLDHYMAVVGYDENYFYLNDPIPENEDPPPVVENQKIPREVFLQAWRDTTKTKYGMVIIQKKV